MEIDMRYLSVCSGIEAATVAWHHMGWKPLSFSEIEPFPIRVLKHHYPDVPVHGDFTTLRDQDWIGDADILVGGTPCQAFSVAGLRQSLDDDRGNLTLEFVRLADAIDNIRRNTRRKPAIIVWENVPGVLSVKDNAFGCFLGELVGCDTALIPTGGKWTGAGMVVGPKRSAAWRILDAQYFGVAQRRRRVFVVAGSGDGFDPSQILFEFDGMRRDTAPSRKAGEKSAPTVTSGPPFSRTGNDRVEADAYVAGTLNARTGLSRGVQDAESGHMLVQTVGTLTRASSAGGTITQQDIQAGHLLVQPIGADCYNGTITGDIACTMGTSGSSVNASGPTVMQPIPFGVGETSDVGHCLRSGASKADKHESTTYIAQPISFDLAQITSALNRTRAEEGLPVSTLSVNSNMHVAEPIAIHPHVVGRSPTSGPQGKEYLEDGSAYTMDSRGVAQAVAQPYSIMPMNSGKDYKARETDVAQPLMTSQVGGNQGGDYVVQPIAFTCKDDGGDATKDLTPTLRAMGSPNGQNNGGGQLAIAQPMAVRRLTPIECERLQGFPDDYTAIPNAADGPRYKALGNSMAVPVMRWIGERINASMGKLSGFRG